MGDTHLTDNLLCNNQEDSSDHSCSQSLIHHIWQTINASIELRLKDASFALPTGSLGRVQWEATIKQNGIKHFHQYQTELILSNTPLYKWESCEPQAELWWNEFSIESNFFHNYFLFEIVCQLISLANLLIIKMLCSTFCFQESYEHNLSDFLKLFACLICPMKLSFSTPPFG